mgnify:CR=1 FL=1
MVGATLFGAVDPAQAISCGQLQTAGNFCNEYVGQYQGGNVYRVEYNNPTHGEQETMTVVCHRRNVITWESQGTLTQSQAEWLAEEFCALPG